MTTNDEGIYGPLSFGCGYVTYNKLPYTVSSLAMEGEFIDKLHPKKGIQNRVKIRYWSKQHGITLNISSRFTEET